MQQQGNRGILQRDQHYKKHPHGTSRQRKQTKNEWDNLQIQMPTHKLP